MNTVKNRLIGDTFRRLRNRLDRSLRSAGISGRMLVTSLAGSDSTLICVVSPVCTPSHAHAREVSSPCVEPAMVASRDVRRMVHALLVSTFGLFVPKPSSYVAKQVLSVGWPVETVCGRPRKFAYERGDRHSVSHPGRSGHPHKPSTCGSCSHRSVAGLPLPRGLPVQAFQSTRRAPDFTFRSGSPGDNRAQRPSHVADAY